MGPKTIQAPILQNPTVDPLWTPLKDPFKGNPILIIQAPILYPQARPRGRSRLGSGTQPSFGDLEVGV